MGRKQPNSSLEQHLEELKKIVGKMDEKNLPLEKSLEQFERGINLVRECQKILHEAEQKIEILLHQNNQEALVPFKENE